MNINSFDPIGKLLIAIAALVIAAGSMAGQVRPIYDRGSMGLVQTLKKLNTSASVLMIGAHPDDEDTALLTYLARGESARTAYLSLTRGDGGQNIIGPELGESLGVIRTEELIQARRLDGAEQFFGRAYDYGFSKTLAEAKSKWDEKIVLCDTVRVIREFQPTVVISQFSGTAADGHGQHQYAGYIAPLAVKAAADSSQCTEAGPAWTVQKFYQRARGGEPRLRVNTGKFDPVLGRSYFEIAMEARSQHKSQEQGVLELRGEQFSGLNLVGSDAKETGIFDGIDTSPSGLANAIRADEAMVKEVFEAARKARLEFDVASPEKILPSLVSGYTVLARMNPTAGGNYMAFLNERRRLFAEAIVLAAGIQIDALADRETVVPGEAFDVSVKVFSPHRDAVRVRDVSLAVPAKGPYVSVGSNPPWWTVAKRPVPTTNSPAFVAREVAIGSEYFTVTPPLDADLTSPYWLLDARRGDLFEWSGHVFHHGRPLAAPVPSASVLVEVNGVGVYVSRPVEYRFADDIRGEIRREINVVPRVTVEMDQSMMIVPYSNTAQTRRVVMTVTNHSTKPVSGTVSLNISASPEWKFASSSPTFEIQRRGEQQAISFDINIPAKTKAGSYQINGGAMVGDTLASSTMKVIAYPHIQTHRFYRRAVTDTKVIDLKTAPVKVGYLVGSGDRVPEAIRQMGFDLQMISEAELASGDLSRFDVIVVGIRAYQVRPDLVANNGRLLDYARAGGTLIVQYQLPGYAQQKSMPFPTQMGPRVADENAPITILVPEHPIFNYPNKITAADFEGWVQERNLYNFTGFGPEYTGLLESHDPGEAENKGGLVIAPLGKGTYIYSSYSFFRQLPAGVEGAYRLFANILSSAAKDQSR
jgi:LmbE family N-acetylglucosaminyl deacetylase